MGERQSIAQKGVRAIDARNSEPENGSTAAKTSVRAPGLSTNEREHPFVWYFGAGWIWNFPCVFPFALAAAFEVLKPPFRIIGTLELLRSLSKNGGEEFRRLGSSRSLATASFSARGQGSSSGRAWAAKIATPIYSSFRRTSKTTLLLEVPKRHPRNLLEFYLNFLGRACNWKNSQKNPRVRKIFCPQFWGRKWLREFYGRPAKNASFLQENLHVHKIPRFRGRGGYFGLGGGKCRFYFYGRGDFSESPILYSCILLVTGKTGIFHLDPFFYILVSNYKP